MVDRPFASSSVISLLLAVHYAADTSAISTNITITPTPTHPYQAVHYAVHVSTTDYPYYFYYCSFYYFYSSNPTHLYKAVHNGVQSDTVHHGLLLTVEGWSDILVIIHQQLFGIHLCVSLLQYIAAYALLILV